MRRKYQYKQRDPSVAMMGTAEDLIGKYNQAFPPHLVPGYIKRLGTIISLLRKASKSPIYRKDASEAITALVKMRRALEAYEAADTDLEALMTHRERWE